ncbi:MAG: type III polyketide synthase [Pseudomonadota bacterium]|nr:type III polyketide synthase [Pseudomonadota bacterium]
MLSAALLSVVTAAPPHVLPQTEVAAVARSLFSGRYTDFDRLSAVFTTAGIHTRRSVRPLDWFLEPRGWSERTEAYLRGAQDLFVEAARQALGAAGLDPADVDSVVTVSSTGIATPSLEARAHKELGFREDVSRVPVFGLGCAGGVSGLSIAARLAEARPGSVVLLVALELCTLAFRPDKLTKASIVATALFGDGAAACVLRAGGEEGLARVRGAGEHIWPDTLDIMGWNVDPQGFDVVFARAIPPFAERRMGPAVAGILDRLGLEPAEIGRFVCHPGGRKVVEALETAFGLQPGALDCERAVLAEYGNMSAPTVFFVLEGVLAQARPDRLALTALGPGFTASTVVLEGAA